MNEKQHTEVDCLFRACVDPDGNYMIHGWGSIREAGAENPGDVDDVLYDGMSDSPETSLRFFNCRMILPLPKDTEIRATAEETT